MPTNYRPDHKAMLDEMLLPHPLIQPGKMFGFPAYYVDRKLCICLYEAGVGLKLPAATVRRLLNEDPHAIPFQPMGKSIMREWVQINRQDSQDYRAYQAIFEESIVFVSEQPKKGKR